MKKASTKELALHNLVVQGDAIALSELFTLHGEALINSLKRWYPKVANRDEAHIFDAVNQALFGYFCKPQTYNPEINSLKRFLEMASERDLLNILQKEKKHLNKKDFVDSVEEEEFFWNSIKSGDDTPEERMVNDQTLLAIEVELAKFFSGIDLLLAKMVISGVRETSAYVELLMIENLSDDEQKQEVKKNKDRIKVILKRNDIENILRAILQ